MVDALQSLVHMICIHLGSLSELTETDMIAAMSLRQCLAALQILLPVSVVTCCWMTEKHATLQELWVWLTNHMGLDVCSRIMKVSHHLLMHSIHRRLSRFEHTCDRGIKASLPR